MIVLKLMRFFLPPFHPLKYRWIEYWYGEQSKAGAWKDLAVKKK
jgi:hypothetical protein